MTKARRIQMLLEHYECCAAGWTWREGEVERVLLNSVVACHAMFFVSRRA